MHLRKFLKQVEQLKKNFFEGVFMIILKICTLENVRNSQTTLEEFFFRECIHEYYRTLHLRKILNQRNNVKNCFEIAFKIIFRKNDTQENFRSNLKKVRPFASRKFGKFYPRCTYSRRKSISRTTLSRKSRK